VVATLGAARRLVDGLAWLAETGEVTVVIGDADHRLLAVLACGPSSARVLAGDPAPVVRPAIAVGGVGIAVVVLGSFDDAALTPCRVALTRAAELAELDLHGVVSHRRGAVPAGDEAPCRVQTSSSRASP
jgi:hypothetical protein